MVWNHVTRKPATGPASRLGDFPNFLSWQDSRRSIAGGTVELSKVRQRYNGFTADVLESKLLSWSYLITNGFRDDSEVRSIVESYPDIEEFAELYGLAVNDPKVVHAYNEAKSAVLEYNNRQEYFAKLEREAEERGMERGMERGTKLGLERGTKLEEERIAANLRALGVDESVIQQAVSR